MNNALQKALENSRDALKDTSNSHEFILYDLANHIDLDSGVLITAELYSEYLPTLDKYLYIDWAHQLLKELGEGDYKGKPRLSKTIWSNPAFETMPELQTFVEGINYLELAAKSTVSSQISTPADWIYEALSALVSLKMRNYFNQHHPEVFARHVELHSNPNASSREKNESVIAIRKLEDANQYRHDLYVKVIEKVETYFNRTKPQTE